MKDLFLSRATADDRHAERVDRALAQRGITCWMAPRDITAGDFATAINDAISACKAFAIIVSEHAAKSDHVRSELSLARSRRKKILPLVFADYQLDGWLEYNLAGIQLIDCRGDRFEPAMDRVAAAVRDEPAPPPPPPPRRRRRDSDFFAALSFVLAVVSAFVPFPIDAIPRTLIVASLLVFPLVRLVQVTRGTHPFVRSIAVLVMLLVSAWILDRAFLRSVIRRTLTPAARPTRVLYEAPYGELRSVHVKASPAKECDPEAPRGAALFGWGGPVGEITIDTFRHPEVAGFRCEEPVEFHEILLTTAGRHEVWEHRTVRLIRQLFAVLGGLTWASASLWFWRRRSSARA